MRYWHSIRTAFPILLCGLASGCVTVSGSGGGPVQGPAFGPVETIGAGQAYQVGAHPTDVATDGRGRWLLVASASTDFGSESDLLICVSNDNGGSWSQPALLHPYFLEDAVNDSTPYVLHGRGNTWVIVWNGWPVAASATSGPSALYSRSVDNGATWTAPARLNPEPLTPHEEESEPVLATDGRGAWICVWLSLSHRPGLGPAEEYYTYLLAAVSTDNAATWSAPMPLYRGPRPGGVSLYDPAAASDGVRAFTVAWTETYSAAGQPRLDRVLAVSTRDRGRTWSPAAVVDNSYGMDLRLAYGQHQTCLALWASGQWVNDAWQPAGLVTSRSTDLGATWSRPAPLIDPVPEATSHHFPRMDTDGRGNWMAVWQVWSSAEHDQDVWGNVSRDNGRTWSAPVVIHSDDPADLSYDASPIVGTDGRGRWLVQWNRRVGDQGSALLYRINDLPRAWWRSINVGIGITGSIPL